MCSIFKVRSSLALVVSGAMLLAGCVDSSAPPPRVATPPEDTSTTTVVRPDIKPLPPQPIPDDQSQLPFDDGALVSQHLPEQRAYVEAYDRVGKPRVAVFVNRTLDGQVMPGIVRAPLATIDRRIAVNGDVNIQDVRSDRDPSINSTRDTTDVYLHPGQYDEAAAKSIDYQAMESILTDWLSAGGRVTIVSPVMARQRLSEQQVKGLQNGNPDMLADAARQLDVDVIVQAQAHPTRQTERGLEIRMIVEAISVKGGESIARAMVDVPPPLDKPQMNKYSRYLARKLMDEMTGSWDAFGGSAPASNQIPPPVPREQNPPAVVAPSTTTPTTLPGPKPAGSAAGDEFGPGADARRVGSTLLEAVA